ncbi:MAG: hypothetical protein C0394_07055 [Syntrophus sp. (in: bacteria)]|nr:hypothetical protein [Syntrophus sp. (in: bacteria)]
MKTASTNSKVNSGDLLRALQPVAAALILLAFAAYLYRPHVFQLGGMKMLIPLSSILAAMGCFVVTRRWISSFGASLLAAAIYGFGPFGLSFIKYHFMAGLCFAAVPWLLCPAVYYHAKSAGGVGKTCLSVLLTCLPFGFIVGLFWMAAHFWAGPLFLMPKNRVLEIADLWGILAPLIFTVKPFAIGFYHLPLLFILMGLFVFAFSGKEMLLVPVLVGIVLSLLGPILDVAPIIWLCFPALFFAVVAGLGLQSFAWAGKADHVWLFICFVAGLLLAGGNYFLGLSCPPRLLYWHTMLLFLGASAAIGCIWILTTLNLRLHWLRWLILFGAAACDLAFIAPKLTDSLF